MTKITLHFALLLLYFSPISGQEKGNVIDRFSGDNIQGVYIPIDLEDCFRQIDILWNDSIKVIVKGLAENEFAVNAHFGFGLWIRNNWQLWSGSRLSKYFNNLGIFHPDDMSGIILVSYHRHLNNKDLKLAEQIQYYKEYWEESRKVEIDYKKEFFEYGIDDTVLFNYNLGFSSKKQENNFLKDKCIAKGIIDSIDIEKNFIKVRLIKSCGKKGIISFDNENTVAYNETTRTWGRPIKREIKYMKNGMECWFNYLDWEPEE